MVFVWGRLSREVHFMRSFGNGTHDMSAVCAVVFLCLECFFGVRVSIFEDLINSK